MEKRFEFVKTLRDLDKVFAAGFVDSCRIDNFDGNYSAYDDINEFVSRAGKVLFIVKGEKDKTCRKIEVLNDFETSDFDATCVLRDILSRKEFGREYIAALAKYNLEHPLTIPNEDEDECQ